MVTQSLETRCQNTQAPVHRFRLLGMHTDTSHKNVKLDKTDYGHVLESFVFSERLKHTTTSDDNYRLPYYRDADKFEIDVVIENSAG